MSCRSTQVKIASTDLSTQEMFTFSEMLALVESESSFGAYVCHRRPGGYRATSDLVGSHFCLPALSTQDEWTEWQIYVIYDVFAKAPFLEGANPTRHAPLAELSQKQYCQNQNV